MNLDALSSEDENADTDAESGAHSDSLPVTSQQMHSVRLQRVAHTLTLTDIEEKGTSVQEYAPTGTSHKTGPPRALQTNRHGQGCSEWRAAAAAGESSNKQ
jgi:hypothetical protein